MSGSLVTRFNTPLSMREAVPILRESFQRVTGEPIAAAAPYLLAMFALENGRGKHISNHNWGNVIKWKPEHDYYLKGNNPRKFRALGSHNDGADYFISTLLSATNKRILQGAYADDFDAFESGIHELHPTTRKAYNHLTGEKRNTLRRTYKRLVNEFKGIPSSTIPIIERSRDAVEIAIVAALVVSVFFVTLKLKRK